MSSSTPTIVSIKPPLCPVCGKASYSLGGVHPQCEVARADKVRKGKPIAKAAKPARSLWSKRCPRCDRQVAARRFACDCGHQFEKPAGR